MRSRRTLSANAGGGCFARPRGIVARLILGTAVACLLVFALWETFLPDVSSAPGGSPAMEAGAESGGEEYRQIDWDSLPESVVAWVDVPGTAIDEPIAQAEPGCPDRYLYEDALGQGAYGTPYIDCECTADSPFVMVYGHNMSDGTVFADFAKFSDRDYAQEHGEIILYQRYGEALRLRPVAVDVVNASWERLVISQSDNLGSAVEKADLNLNETNAMSRLVAFATCSYQTKNSRTVVYASEFPGGNAH